MYKPRLNVSCSVITIIDEYSTQHDYVINKTYLSDDLIATVALFTAVEALFNSFFIFSTKFYTQKVTMINSEAYKIQYLTQTITNNLCTCKINKQSVTHCYFMNLPNNKMYCASIHISSKKNV